MAMRVGGGMTLPSSRTRRALSRALKQVEHALDQRQEALCTAHAAAVSWRSCYLDVYDHAPAGYLTLDVAGDICDANPTTARLLGRERNDLIGASFGRFLT